MITNLRKKAKNDFEKKNKLMNNAVSHKTMENVRKHRNIKLHKAEKSNYFVSKPSYHITKFFKEYLLLMEMKKQRYL